VDLLNLAGRVGLVTGAGQGVGRQIALHLAAHQARVVVTDLFLGRAEAVAAEIEAPGGAAFALRCDVTDYHQVEAVVAAALDHFGALDILVNNAGNTGAAGLVLDSRPFWETDPSDWAPWVDVNFTGVLNCCRAVLPGMVDRGFGRLVTVVSDAGRTGEPFLVVYSGAKAGAAGFMRGLAKAVGRHNITANCVALASMRTPSTEAIVADAERMRRMLSGYVIRRPGEPADAANMVLFLASDAASWITGQTYPVNGGYSFAL
jgi:3-oxoacyl-[acyl-carrier protein] reductase